MNTSHERSRHPTNEWYTPKAILDSLGEFDLDPCAAINPPWQTAKTMYNRLDNGLDKPWFGRVWLNPPYSRPLIEQFVRKMAEHNHGTALLFCRCDTDLWQDVILPGASAIKFLRHRIRFYRPDGTQATATAGAPSALIAFGNHDAETLSKNPLPGFFINLQNQKT